jgi:hypothetical protein
MSRINKKSKGSRLFSVSVPMFASTIIKIRAESAEEALEIAQQTATAPSVCHQCSSDIEVGEVDCESLTIECVCEIEGDDI